jgi:hypothetical protein
VRALARFGRFWYDFIVGDDWSIALGVVAAVAITAVLAHAGVVAWPVLPVGVASGLTWSVRSARAARRPKPTAARSRRRTR